MGVLEGKTVLVTGAGRGIAGAWRWNAPPPAPMWWSMISASR